MTMATVTIQTQAGKKAGSADLADALFGVEPNMSVMHQVVTAQLAAKRAGTHSTKTPVSYTHLTLPTTSRV